MLSRDELGRHPVEHAAVDSVGILFPAEHAHGGDAVEGDVTQRCERLVPGDVAERAVQAIIERLDHGRIETREIVLDPTLVVRGTTGPPRPGSAIK